MAEARWSFNSLLQFLLELLPFRAGDAGFAENSCQQFRSNLTLVWVRDWDPGGALHHRLVATAGNRPVETGLPQVGDKVSATDRSEGRHYATCRTFRSRPSTTGRG
jgi:hypothetical protein